MGNLTNVGKRVGKRINPLKEKYQIKCNVYPYSWLDEIVGVTLNPTKTNVVLLEKPQLDLISEKFNQEIFRVFNDLKQRTFFLFSDRKIKSVVTHYYESLICLEKQAEINLAAYPAYHPISETGEYLLIVINQIKNFFNKHYEQYLPQSRTLARKTIVEAKPLAKLHFKLSVDQLGILMKAADDTKLILSNSLSLIFRLIVPYLSTDKTQQISWNSMRKSTYQMEQSDKDFVIQTLEKLILKIKQF
jgi:hypothetical protein